MCPPRDPRGWESALSEESEEYGVWLIVAAAGFLLLTVLAGCWGVEVVPA